MLEAGMKAPEFALPDQNGKVHTLEEYKGKKSDLIFLSERQHSGMYKTGMWFRRIIS